MWNLRIGTLASVLLIFTLNAQADVIVERHVVITPVPADKEVVVAPVGYTHCFSVSAGWYNDVWVPEHKVCQYEKTAQGTAWVAGYWKCTMASSDGTCTKWEWSAGHWEQTLEVY